MACDKKDKELSNVAEKELKIAREGGNYTPPCVRCQAPLVRGECPYHHAQGLAPEVAAKRPQWGDTRWARFPPAPRQHVEEAEAVLYGMGVGDALAAPVEFTSLASIRSRYGRQGIQDLPACNARYTDDTQMALYLARALVDAGEQDTEGVMQAVTRQFVSWADDPTTFSRAPGGTCLSGVRALRAGRHWTKSGVYSRGCGSAMRVPPVGYLYQHDPQRLREVASATGIATHSDPAADAATVGMAYLVKLALDGEPPATWPARVLEFAGDISPIFNRAIERVQECIDWPNEDRALEHLGRGWVGDEAVALALYCVMRYPDDYPAAVRRAANTEGDSDSIACLAGALSAARLGVEAIPKDWRERLEDSGWIGAAAQHLAAKKVQVQAVPPQPHHKEPPAPALEERLEQEPPPPADWWDAYEGDGWGSHPGGTSR